METHFGYFAVILPQYETYRGIFIPHEAAQIGPAHVAAARKLLGGRFQEATAVTTRAHHHLSFEDESLAGSLAASLVRTFIDAERGSVEAFEKIGTVGAALSHLSQYRYFYVVATLDNDDIDSTLRKIDVDSVEAARNAINDLPETRRIRTAEAARAALKLIRGR